MPLGTGECALLSTEVAGGFTGVYIGVYATGDGRPCTVPAYFDWFEYKPQ
ncbi:beta-xylosidase family glycoside hydrolase [Paenibacillus caseinilyticus]|nr:xylan 1,4-beta-xylosidase [Paenibacillus mucilaginosus]